MEEYKSLPFVERQLMLQAASDFLVEGDAEEVFLVEGDAEEVGSSDVNHEIVSHNTHNE